MTGRNGATLLTLQMISLCLTWFCWDCSTNTSVLASSLKRFTLAFEVFKLEGEFVPDAEGISCVAGLLKGFRMLLSKKNSSKDSEGFPMEKVTNITEGQISHTPHCCTQTSAHKYKEKKSFQLWNSEPIGGVEGGKERVNWSIYSTVSYLHQLGRKGKKEPSSGSAHTQVFAVSRKNLQRSKCKLFPSFRLKAHWN